jgi:PD-(D/E)XK nuclease superfamily
MTKKYIYTPGQEDPFRISRSKVDLFLNCPCCFYLDVRLGVKRPPGFPFNLNSAVDALLKKEFDHYRAENLPHPYMIGAGINAIPYQNIQLETWRSNFKGVSFVHEATNLETFVVDYKATSKADAVTLDADWQIGYKRQMEFYQWLLRQNGYTVATQGWFVYCNGLKDKSVFNNRLDFTVSMLPYVGDDSWVNPTLHAIKDCLDADEIPNAADDCEYCQYALKYANACSDL